MSFDTTLLSPCVSSVRRQKTPSELVVKFFEGVPLLSIDLLDQIRRLFPQLSCSRSTARQAKAALEQAAEAGQQGEEKELENQKLKRQVEKSVELVELIEKRQEARRANRYKGELQISATEPEAAIQPLKSKEYRPSYRP
jgi:hypothetical protein